MRVHGSAKGNVGLGGGTGAYPNTGWLGAEVGGGLAL